ncbi:MAG: OsmC family protein [Cyclobacteriaceae bacterium]|nr:MAG: OsmC family protein [Cyclobacteriaceae bacterium]
MTKISSRIKTDNYRIEIKSPTGNVVIADEPVEKGGKDTGFSPKELLAAALAACTSATVRMYADRKQWPLNEVTIDVDLVQDEKGSKTVINRKIHFAGNLDEEQKKRLLAVANACPVHKILSSPVEINTTM